MSSPSLPNRVLRLFKGFFSDPERPRPRLQELPFSLHLVVGASSVKLFAPGPLDVLSFHQRHHRSLHHHLEYVVCLPRGADPEAYQPYAVLRLRPEEETPLVPLDVIERKLQKSYGTFIELPRTRPLLERQWGRDLTDEDPPEGLNRARAPATEKPVAGRLGTAEVLDVIRRELSGPEVISWLEAAFQQPPAAGKAEHRYYLDATACVFLVRDHPEEGKTLYRATTSAAALRPERPAPG